MLFSISLKKLSCFKKDRECETLEELEYLSTFYAQNFSNTPSETQENTKLWNNSLRKNYEPIS